MALQGQGAAAQFNRNAQALVDYIMRTGIMQKEFAGRRDLLEQERQAQQEYLGKQSEAWSRNTQENIAGQLRVIGEEFKNQLALQKPVQSYISQSLRAEIDGDDVKAAAFKDKAVEHAKRIASPLRKMFEGVLPSGVDIEELLENWTQEGVQNILLDKSRRYMQVRDEIEAGKERTVRGQAIEAENAKTLAGLLGKDQESREASLKRYDQMATDIMGILQSKEKTEPLLTPGKGIPPTRRGEMLTELAKVKSTIAAGKNPTAGQIKILEKYWNPQMSKVGQKLEPDWAPPKAEEGGLFEEELATISDDDLMMKIRAKASQVEKVSGVKVTEDMILGIFNLLRRKKEE